MYLLKFSENENNDAVVYKPVFETSPFLNTKRYINLLYLGHV